MPGDSQDLISQLLRRLEESVAKELPNPSVLLAMNLAGDTASAARNVLLQQIKEEAVEKAQGMTSGQVALYVLALLSSDVDPWQVHAKGRSVNLVQILRCKTDEELSSLVDKGVPVTTLFQVGLDTLALCLLRTGSYEEASKLLAKELLKPENNICVDTRAMAVLGLVCAYGHVDQPDLRDLLKKALWMVTNGFLDEQEQKGGLIGNIDSMGLAMQALQVSKKFYAPREWNSAQAFAVVLRHDYVLPMAIAQVLPILVGKSYLDAGVLQDVSSPAGTIRVHYTITNQLQGEHFCYNITVEVPAGSVLLRVLQVAKEKEPDKFSFQTEKTSWGLMVISIHGLAGNKYDKTYWQFLSNGDPLQEGVGTYKPHDGEHIKAVFSRERSS